MNVLRALLIVAILCLPALSATMRTEVIRLADTRGSRVLTVSTLEGRTQAIELEILQGQHSEEMTFLSQSEELQDLQRVLREARVQLEQNPTLAKKIGSTRGGILTLSTTARGRVVITFVKGAAVHLAPADLDRLSQSLEQSARVLRR